jgi:hypothetical protein
LGPILLGFDASDRVRRQDRQQERQFFAGSLPVFAGWRIKPLILCDFDRRQPAKNFAGRSHAGVRAGSFLAARPEKFVGSRKIGTSGHRERAKMALARLLHRREQSKAGYPRCEIPSSPGASSLPPTGSGSL